MSTRNKFIIYYDITMFYCYELLKAMNQNENKITN